jgi:hypothetical protein
MLQSQYSIHFRQTQTQVNQSLSGYGPGTLALASRNLITQHDMISIFVDKALVKFAMSPSYRARYVDRINCNHKWNLLHHYLPVSWNCCQTIGAIGEKGL